MLPEKDFDVLIAGAGPAGLSAALAAAQGGLRVAVFERSKEIGYPIHTSGGSWISDMRELGIPERFTYPIHCGRFIAPSVEAVFRYDEPVSCILDVRGLYQHLALQAAEAGASIRIGCHVEAVLQQDGKCRGLRLRSAEEWLAPLVIDATGMTGALSQQMGLRGPFTRYGSGAECDCYAREWPADTVAFLFGGMVGSAGYGWIFPHHDRRVRIGVGIIHPDGRIDPRNALSNFISAASEIGLRVDPCAMIEYHTGVIPSVPPLKKCVAHGFVTVGDAAGLISTLLGEGIRFAIALGRLAGKVAVEAHNAGTFDAEFLSCFDSAWRKRFGKLFILANWANRRLASYDDEAWDEKIRMLQRFPAEAIPPLLKGNWTDPRFIAALMRSRPKSKLLWRLVKHGLGLKEPA